MDGLFTPEIIEHLNESRKKTAENKKEILCN